MHNEVKILKITKWALAGICLVAIILACMSINADATPWNVHQKNKDTAHEIAEMLRAEGHPEDHPVILACQEWWREENQKEEAALSERIIYTTKEQRSEYPEASYVWQLLKEAGLSDIHAAAILGNAMAESGGHTLNINIYQDESGFWGAWAMSTYYFPDVYGKGADAQVAKILETLDSNMSVGGGSAKSFYAIQNVRDAAKYFSDYWERPAAWNSARADDAEFAFNYFAG